MPDTHIHVGSDSLIGIKSHPPRSVDITECSRYTKARHAHEPEPHPHHKPSGIPFSPCLQTRRPRSVATTLDYAYTMLQDAPTSSHQIAAPPTILGSIWHMSHTIISRNGVGPRYRPTQ